MKTLIITLLVCSLSCSADEVLTRDERIIALTILGEARGEGQLGMFAVGCVIQNRVRERKLTAAQVCLQYRQFSIWNKDAPLGAGRNLAPRKVRKKESELYYLWSSKEMMYARSLARWINEKSTTLGDVTNGANHFCTKDFNPHWTVESLKPLKFRKPVETIGNHKFYKLP